MRRPVALLVAVVLAIAIWAHMDDLKTDRQRCEDQQPTTITVADRWAARVNAVAYAVSHPPHSFIELIMDMSRLLGRWRAAVAGGFQGTTFAPPAGLCACLLNQPSCPTPPCAAGDGQPAPPPSQPSPDPAMLRAVSLGQQSGATEFDAEQVAIAGTAWQVAQQLRLPDRAVQIILSAGLIESSVHNLHSGDRDSLGWLQQRPSQGWGSPAQVTNVNYATRKFYGALVQVRGWQSMNGWDAAQAVQRSAFPGAYQQTWDKAGRLLARVAGQAPSAPGAPSGASPCPAAPVASVGLVMAGTRTVRDVESGITYHIPIPAGKAGQAVNFALNQLGKPYVWAAHGPSSFDCSGLVSAAWRAAGVDVFPQTEVEWRQEPRATGLPRAGDLWGWPGHVQMFLGRVGGVDLVVEAPRPGRRIHIVTEYQTPSRKMRPYGATPTGVAV